MLEMRLNFTVALAAAALVTHLYPQQACAQFAEPGVLIRTIVGDGGGEFFGYVANPVKDVNGDGATDIVVGAAYAAFAGPGTGRIYLISGATGDRLAAIDGLPNDYLGNSVNDAGDVNNDGINDLIAGAPGLPFNGNPGVNGRIAVYSGAPPYQELWSRTGEALNDRFGTSVAGLHDDFDGDGHNDVLATANLYDGPAGTNSGRAYILSGFDGSTLLTINGTFPQGFLGTAICSMTDLNGDGLRDVAVSARDDGPGLRGQVYIYSDLDDVPVIRTCVPEATGLNLGFFFMNAAGDVDGDGLDDLYAADFGDGALGAGTGRAYFFSGADGSQIRNWTGSAAQQGFGIGRAVGDINGDGVCDLFAAAWVGDVGALNAGEGYVLSGRTGNVLQQFTCTIPNTQAGYDAIGVGDVNGDGKADYVLTGQGVDAAAIANGDGVLYLLAGRTPLAPALGDMNCDGAISVSDIAGFVLAVTDAAAYAAQYPDCNNLLADLNDDQLVSVSDIGLFVNLLTQ